jgi:hypothetical protein
LEECFADFLPAFFPFGVASDLGTDRANKWIRELVCTGEFRGGGKVVFSLDAGRT